MDRHAWLIWRMGTWMVMAALCAALTGCATPPTATPAAHPALTLESCQLTHPGLALTVQAQCGTLTVPEDRANPNGRQIALHVAVVPAVSRTPAPDPIFILAGGPGQAATEVYPALEEAFAQLNQERDVVLVDQRGTGESNPLECHLPEEEGSFVTDEVVIAALKACPAQLDADLRFYTTEIAMQDLDAVRAALGYEQINLYGASYGTRAGLTYLRLYPEHVRTLVLDAVVSPEFVIYKETGQDADRAMSLLFQRCQADAACQTAFPDLQAEFETLLEQLTAQPRPVTMPNPTTGQTLQFTMTREIFVSLLFPQLYTPEISALVPLGLHTAYTEGNFAPLLAQGAAADAGIYLGLFYATACTEDAAFIDPTAVAQTGDESYFGDRSRTFREVCAAWPQGTLAPDFHQPVTSDKPVLLLSGEADPITPPQYAEQAAQTLPNSLHLIAKGMGHGLMGRGCVSNLVTDFVKAGTAQRLDTACVQKITPPPFFVDFTGPQS